MRAPSASRPVASASSRAGSWVATTSVARRRRALRARGRGAPAPSSSRAVCGSSSTSSSGAWSSARQSASRCVIPRENVGDALARAPPRGRTARAASRSARAAPGRGRGGRRARGSRARSARGRGAARARRSRRARGRAATSSVPRVGAARPTSSRSSVVFPEPFGPVTTSAPTSEARRRRRGARCASRSASRARGAEDHDLIHDGELPRAVSTADGRALAQCPGRVANHPQGHPRCPDATLSPTCVTHGCRDRAGSVTRAFGLAGRPRRRSSARRPATARRHIRREGFTARAAKMFGAAWSGSA